MPTGLTNDIYSGTDMTLRSFALKCANKFAEVRDDVPLPRDHRPNLREVLHIAKSPSSIVENLERAKKNLVLFLDLARIHSNLELLYQKDMVDKEKHYNDLSEDNETRKQRYHKMTNKVIAWKPPQELEPLKHYMIDQLRQSCEHDCVDVIPPRQEKVTSFDEWVQNKLDSLLSDLKFYFDEMVINNKFINETNHYLDVLYDELDKVDPVLKVSKSSPVKPDECCDCVNYKGCITCTDHDQKQTL